MIDDLDNTHRNEDVSTFELENSGNKESKGETDEDLLSDYEREVLNKILSWCKIIKKKKDCNMSV